MSETKTKKTCGLTAATPTDESMEKRPDGRGWQYVLTEDGRYAWIRIRKLTPKECFRLMDVDEHNIEKLLNSGVSNSQLYKLAGNSICVCCMEHLFKNLFIKE